MCVAGGVCSDPSEEGEGCSIGLEEGERPRGFACLISGTGSHIMNRRK